MAETLESDEAVGLKQATTPSLQSDADVGLSTPPPPADPNAVATALHAFGTTFSEDWKEPLGLSPETTQFLSKHGIFAPSDQSKYTNPFQAMNELVAVAVGAGLPRAISSTIHATQAALRAVPQSEVQKLLGERTLSSELAGFLDYYTTGQTDLGIPKATEAARVGELAREEIPPVREAPIVQFRKDAAAIESRLPPVAEGDVRLWRGDRPGEAGTTFTNDLPGIALPFRKAYGGVDLSYVDVPAADLPKYENKAGTATFAEFNLPEDVAARAAKAEAPEVAKTGELRAPEVERAPVQDQAPQAEAGGKTPIEPRPSREFIDTRGAGTQYHGSSAPELKPSNEHYSELNYYGQGFYTTDSVDIAHGYSRRGAKQTGERNLYEVTENRPLNILDGEAPIPDAVREAITPKLDEGIPGPIDHLLKDILDENPKNMRELYDEIRDAFTGENYSADTVQEVFDSFNYNLQNLGYDGMSHTGGLRTGKQPHQVVIYFNPEKDLTISKGNFEQFSAAPKPLDLNEARQLGVIGPDPLDRDQVAPEEAAKRAIPAEQQAPTISGQLPEDTPWMQRFKGSIGKMTDEESVFDNIIRTARENNEFPEIRQGPIPAAHIAQLGEASGISSAAIDVNKLSSKLKNNAEVRVAIQGMLTAAENVRDAARDLTVEPTPENRIKMQEAVTRQEMVVSSVLRDSVEEVVGLRAEFGRIGNVLQEFMRTVKDAESLKEHLKQAGQTPEDLDKLAKGLNSLPRSGAARLLNDARSKPGFYDKFMWYWVNALISGPITHAKYLGANTAMLAHEALVVTPVAGVIGTIRRLSPEETGGVRLTETLGSVWGMTAGVPDAFKGAIEAFKSGLQTPTPGEVTLGIIPKRNKNVFFQQVAPKGGVGQVYGIPMKSAAFIHSFYNVLGYRYSIEKQAFRIASEEGLRIGEQDFWERRQYLSNNPTEAMMKEAIPEAYRLSFINELGPKGKALSEFVNKVPIAKMAVPFTHIPANVFKAGEEAAGLGFLDKTARDALAGRSGPVAQDMARARMVIGAATATWVTSEILNDRITGPGPADPQKRAQWLATGHQPYSIRVNNEWISYNRFGSIGVALGIQAGIAEAIRDGAKADDDQVKAAAGLAAHNLGRLALDEVGMQGIANITDAINSPPGQKIDTFIGNYAGSMLPWSSFLRQTASAMDPEMRKAQSISDHIRYYLPGAGIPGGFGGRETLVPKRDPLGNPIHNPGFGGDLPLPVISSILRHGEATPDPILAAMANAGMHPAPPKNSVGGVQLPPMLYDKYQELAGALARTTLGALINEPRWGDMPPGKQAETMRKSLERAHESAGKILMGLNPSIIEKGKEIKLDRINGFKPPKLQDEPIQGPPAASSMRYIPPGEGLEGAAPPAEPVPGNITGPRA